MANNTNSNEQGRHGTPLTPTESHALTDIGQWLVSEDPALATMLGATQPPAARRHSLVTELGYVLIGLVVASLAAYLGVLLAGVAFSRAMSAWEFALVIGSVGLTALIFVWVLFFGDSTLS
jgi:Protein of unknown function (DUF3040)